MVDGECVLLLRLLCSPEAFEFFGEQGDIVFKIPEEPLRPIQFVLTGLKLRRDFAQFALESKRAAARLLAAADGMAVIADAIRQEKVDVRVLQGETLRRGAILGQEAPRQARDQLSRSLGEAVGHAENGTEAADDSGFRTDGRFGNDATPDVLVFFRMDEERGAAVHVAAHQIDAAIGFGPVLYDYVFEFFMKKLFGRFFKGRFHFNEIGEDPDGLQVVDMAGLYGCK